MAKTLKGIDAIKAHQTAIKSAYDAIKAERSNMLAALPEATRAKVVTLAQKFDSATIGSGKGQPIVPHYTRKVAIGGREQRVSFATVAAAYGIDDAALEAFKVGRAIVAHLPEKARKAATAADVSGEVFGAL